ncbi:MAG: sigma-70 family RNA polymerase sigma factor [Bacilli bacterium]
MDKIINEIKNIKVFDLKKYYELIEKYGEKNVINAFRTLLVNGKNDESKMHILRKYCYAYITIDIENLVIDKNSYKKLCNKYGENNVDKYIIEYEEIGTNAKISDNISKILDFLVKDEEEKEENITDNDFNNDVIVDDYTDDPVKQYLKEIGKIPTFSEDEEKEIFRKYNNAIDEKEKIKIKQKIVTANLKLVVSIAKKYVKPSYSILDVIQDGNIGLMKAIDKYDLNKGYKFSTYATWWIKQSITRALSEKSRMIRLPVHICELIRKVTANREKLAYELGREPNDDELAKSLGISVQKLKEVTTIINEPISLQTPVGEEEDESIESFVPDENHSIEEDYYKIELKDLFSNIFSTLSPKEQTVIKLRFGFDNDKILTLEEVGNVLGVTRERVRQIESKALRKLNRNKDLRSFHG